MGYRDHEGDIFCDGSKPQVHTQVEVSFVPTFPDPQYPIDFCSSLANPGYYPMITSAHLSGKWSGAECAVVI